MTGGMLQERLIPCALQEVAGGGDYPRAVWGASPVAQSGVWSGTVLPEDGQRWVKTGRGRQRGQGWQPRLWKEPGIG